MEETVVNTTETVVTTAAEKVSELESVWSTKDLIMGGLAYTVMGILIVFLVLVLIMLVIKAMALFSSEKKPKAVAPVETPVQTVAETVENKADDTELIAVITAAIAVMTQQSTSDFVVRSYKKVSGGAWNKAGRREMLENKF